MSRRIALLITAVGLVAGCGQSGAGHGPQARVGSSLLQASGSSSSSASNPVRVVAIGDSDTTGEGDPTGLGWVGRYAGLLHRRLDLHRRPDREVAVDNRAVAGETSAGLRDEVAKDSTLRRALARADIVLIGIGGADLNVGDAALQAGTCVGRACYAPVLARFGRNLAGIVAGVRQLAPSALLRAISLPNGYPGARNAFPPFVTAELSRYQSITERELVCKAVQRAAGRCVDVVRAFNGTHANLDAYRAGLMTKDPCCYPSGKGQQLIAQLLVRTGGYGP